MSTSTDADHAEWAARAAPDGPIRLSCQCGWTGLVERSDQIAAALAGHRTPAAI